MQLDKKLYDDINEYCKLNSLKTRDFIHKLLKEAFLKEKYGDSPFAFYKQSEPNIENTREIVFCKEQKTEVDNILNINNNVPQTNEETPTIITIEPETNEKEVQEEQISVISIEKAKPKKKRTLK